MNYNQNKKENGIFKKLLFGKSKICSVYIDIR